MIETLGCVVCLESSEAGVVDAAPISGGPMHNFKFAKPKDLVLQLGSKSEKTITSIGDVIKASGADKLFGHAPFTKGVPPPSFAVKKEMTFQPKEQSDQSAIQAAMKATKVNLLWVVAVDATNKICPKGLAIVTAGQLVLKVGEDFVL
jgi:hypothetical protein